VLRPNSRFRAAADVWLQKIGERRADSTLDLYTHWLNKVVLPELGELRLAECTRPSRPTRSEIWSASNRPAATRRRRRPVLVRFAIGTGLRMTSAKCASCRSWRCARTSTR
jgi:hypothetical protein